MWNSLCGRWFLALCGRGALRCLLVSGCRFGGRRSTGGRGLLNLRSIPHFGVLLSEMFEIS
jgi:hypothetical protein